MGMLHSGGAQITVIRAKFDPSRRGQSGIVRQPVKALNPVPQEKLLEQFDVNRDGGISYQRQGLTQSWQALEDLGSPAESHHGRPCCVKSLHQHQLETSDPSPTSSHANASVAALEI